MGSLDTLISDLALLLVVAGITTLLCRKFNQPSVLGYILDSIVSAKYGGSTVCDELGLPVRDSGLTLPCGAAGRWTSA